MLVVALCTLLFSMPAAGDWLQWGGPSRNFQVPAALRPPTWPASGPNELWTRDLGDGYSSMLIAGNTLYTMYRKGASDVVIALDSATGKTIWETGIEAPHAPGMNVEG